jgi:hypothetical protein
MGAGVAAPSAWLRFPFANSFKLFIIRTPGVGACNGTLSDSGAAFFGIEP